jgi:hypothetical protein
MVPRGPGRPSDSLAEESDSSAEESEDSPHLIAPPAKKPPGRPRKIQPAAADNSLAASADLPPLPKKRGPGRPPKVQPQQPVQRHHDHEQRVEPSTQNTGAAGEAEPQRRGPGRPKGSEENNLDLDVF